jgi:pSer/pThr/pTyr-binding forkhead associated (FHA) protein
MLPGGGAQAGIGPNDERTVMLGRRRDDSPADACFLVTAGPDKGEQIELRGDVVLGRGDSATARLSDRRISEMHAQVKRVGKQYIYQDLLSTNGSHLIAGGRRVLLRDSHILADADEIELGHTVLRFIQMDSGGRR